MPSDLHLDLQHRSVAWARPRSTGRGIRAGLEILLAPQYVADAVVLLSFQHRFAEEYRLLVELDRMRKLDPEVACVFECKVSRSDFMATFGKPCGREVPRGNLHWVVAPAGVINEARLPPIWGILETSGRGLAEKRCPTNCPLPAGRLEEIAYQLLWYGTEHRRHKAAWEVDP